jgi:hypothetical protein
MPKRQRQFSMVGRFVAVACGCALFASTAHSDDPQDAAATSPLRKSLRDAWRVEYMMKQRPPNRGRRLITLDEDGQISGSIRREKTLSAEERDKLLDLAVRALEAFAFEPRMGNIVDSPEMSLSLSSGTRQIKIQIVEFGGEKNLELITLLKHFETLADGGDPGPPPARNNAKRLSAIAGKWNVKVAIDNRPQALVEDRDEGRDLALKAVRDFSFETDPSAGDGTTNVSLSITSPSLEGFRRIEISEKWLRSDAVRKSFVADLVKFDQE